MIIFDYFFSIEFYNKYLQLCNNPRAKYNSNHMQHKNKLKNITNPFSKKSRKNSNHYPLIRWNKLKIT
jgi:hypothetical protein